MDYGAAAWLSWIWMGFWVIAFWAVVLAVVVWTVRSFNQNAEVKPPQSVR